MNPAEHDACRHRLDRFSHVPPVFPSVPRPRADPGEANGRTLRVRTMSAHGVCRLQSRPRIAAGDDRPLAVLALGSAVVGAYFEWTHGFERFSGGHAVAGLLVLDDRSMQPSRRTAVGMMILSTVVDRRRHCGGGRVYLGRRTAWPGRLARWMDVFGLYWLSRGKFFYRPDLFGMVVRPLETLHRAGAAWFDRA